MGHLEDNWALGCGIVFEPIPEQPLWCGLAACPAVLRSALMKERRLPPRTDMRQKKSHRLGARGAKNSAPSVCIPQDAIDLPDGVSRWQSKDISLQTQFLLQAPSPAAAASGGGGRRIRRRLPGGSVW
jgi:hypothetical protein